MVKISHQDQTVKGQWYQQGKKNQGQNDPGEEVQKKERHKNHKSSKTMMFGKKVKTMRRNEGTYGRRYIKQEESLQRIYKCLKT